ncbi:MAG: hypothetical protein ACRDPS_11045 [Nocardioides sp.]|uniref:hypothetical protein n=1 Tax=Nocardioides sp. TaxID=35761 RepID=UPI003D6BC1EF
MSPHARQFFDHVARVCDGTPYKATETARGFDVEIDLSAPQWRSKLQGAQLSWVFTYHVSTPSRNSYAIIEDTRSIVWFGDVPHTQKTGVRRIEANDEQTDQGVWTVHDPESVPDLDQYRFDAEEGRTLITSVARLYALQQRAARHEGLGYSVAVGLVVTLSVIATVIGVAVILSLMGTFDTSM